MPYSFSVACNYSLKKSNYHLVPSTNHFFRNVEVVALFRGSKYA